MLIDIMDFDLLFVQELFECGNGNGVIVEYVGG